MWSPPVEGLVRAAGAVRRALELDPDLGPAHAALAKVLAYRDWDWEAAERGFRMALDLDPGDVYGRQLYVEMLAGTGRLDEAIAEQRRVRELDPFWVSASSVDMGRLYEIRGEDDRAVAEWERALELAPGYYVAHQHLGNHHCARGRLEAGIAALKRAATLSPEDPHVVADVAYCYAISGRTEQARGLLRELERESRNRYVSPMTRALVHVGLGERDQAFEQLEGGYRGRALMLPLIGIDARFAPLHSDPRFGALLARMGLAEGYQRGR
jgi:serine/threonine-protein kinase